MIIMFSTTPTLVSRLICWATRSRFSHCELVWDNMVISTLPVRGTHLTTLGDAATGLSSRLDVDIPDMEPVWAYMKSQLGRPYDWSGVLGRWLRTNWQSDSRWFCSELLAHALIRHGYLPPVDCHRVTPDQLLQLIVDHGDQVMLCPIKV